MDYDDVSEISWEIPKLRKRLEDSELLGDFGGPCRHCIKESVTLKIDRSCSKEGVVWRCTNEDCGGKKLIRHDPCFAKLHLSLEKIIIGRPAEAGDLYLI